jgi:hypothetical protein
VTPNVDHPGGVLERAQARLGQVGIGLYSLVCCFVVLGIAECVGIATEQPWVFPSLGPSVMLFFESPRVPASTTKNTIVGHLVAIGAGALCLRLSGFYGDPPAVITGLTAARVVAAAASVAITAFVLRLVKCPHPPAGATTLIVSLGILQGGKDLGVMAMAVFLVALLALAINHLLGVDQEIVEDV